MKHGKVRTVPVYKMFTKSGKPVYQFASMKSFTLTEAPGRQAQIVGEDPNSNLHKLRITKATEIVGEQCEWRLVGETEVMAIYF